MAEKIEPRPMYSKELNVTNLMPTYWEFVNINIREYGGAIIGCVVLKCINNIESNDAILNLGMTFPNYMFATATVSNGLWDYVASKVVRVYLQISGNLIVNVPFTAGEYLTIPFTQGYAF